MTRLSGKIALVTGASKGIGAGIALAFAKERAKVAVNYASSREGADKVVAQIAAKGGQAVAVRGDVSKKADVERIFSEVTSVLGPVDVLVNNAGVYEMGPLSDITEESFHRQFGINVLGMLLASQAAAAQFGPDGGSIINIGSIVTRLNMPGSAIYTATKASVDSITRILAKELGPKKVRVNALNPGLIVTEGTQTAGFAEGDMAQGIAAQTPLGRLGQPGDVAPVAVFLASDEAGWVTGETLAVSGGS